MGSGICKKYDHTSKIIIDTISDPNETYIQVSGCFYNNPVDLVLVNNNQHDIIVKNKKNNEQQKNKTTNENT